MHCCASTGVLNFYRTGAVTQAVILQYTGLALGQGAPLELTFKLGNTDTVRKRLSLIVHNPAFSDLAICNFWLDPQQPLTSYAMRLHTTHPDPQAWTDASVSFYAADVNARGSTGAYQLDDVTLTHRPSLSAAKTESVDPLVVPALPHFSLNLILNPGFAEGFPTWGWQPIGAMTWQLANTVLELHRGAGSPAPAVEQVVTSDHQPWWADQDQRLQATFELANTSSTRQRVTVTLKNPDGSDFTNCVFWLNPNTPRALYAMSGYAGVAWSNVTFSLAPVTTPPAGHWLQLDTVDVRRTNRTILGTEPLHHPRPDACRGPGPPDPGPLMTR